MNVIDAMYQRRSIRRYQDTPVEDEKIEILLKAAMAAPSAHNAQPWHFVVAKSDTVEKIRDFPLNSVIKFSYVISVDSPVWWAIKEVIEDSTYPYKYEEIPRTHGAPNIKTIKGFKAK